MANYDEAILAFYNAFPYIKRSQIDYHAQGIKWLRLLYSGLDSAYPLSWVIQDLRWLLPAEKESRTGNNLFSRFKKWVG